MPSMKLTADNVERAKPSATLTEILDLDPKARGLALRITPAGMKSWTLRYRLETGERKRITLGQYPAMSLSKARDAVAMKLAAVVDGRDPAKEKKETRQKAEMQRLETLAFLADRYFEAARKGRHRHGAKKPKRESTIKLETYYWERFVRPAFGQRPIRSIARADIQLLVNEQSSASVGRQIRVVFQRLFAFAQWMELVDVDPSHFVQVDAVPARERVLSADEMRALMNALDDQAALNTIGVSRARAIGIALCALTLQRRSEVAGMDLAELDLPARTWTIPGARTKNGRQHVVPLSHAAASLIEEAISLRSVGRTDDRAGPVFPASRGALRPVQAPTLTRAFIDVAALAKVRGARLHDLRRTGATEMTSERIGISRFIVSRVLNHASDTGDAAAVTGVYDRNAYLPDKRRALDAWAKRLEQISTGQPTASNVVAFGQVAG